MKPERADDRDEMALVLRMVDGDQSAFEVVMRRYNAALFRAARAIVQNDADAEDVLQDAYLAAFRHMSEFRGESRLSTWLTRIVINEALARRRKRERDNVVPLYDERDGEVDTAESETMTENPSHSPELGAMREEVRRVLERKIDALPLVYRAAFMLREVEEMTIEETAECLAVPEATVRTRVFRARALLRAALAEEFDLAARDVFAFAGARCDRTVAEVLARLRAGRG